MGLTPPPWLRRRAALGVVCAYVVASLADAAASFTRSPGLFEVVQPLRRVFAPTRMINTYHLFGAITVKRIEPELQTFDGAAWTGHDLRYKPGDVTRAPVLAAPHQPRVDFQLWFYGLSYRRGMPPYVAELLDRACHDPAAVQTLFASELPSAPSAVRMELFRYHFTTPDERRRTGAWWTRESIEATRPLQCRSRQR